MSKKAKTITAVVAAVVLVAAIVALVVAFPFIQMNVRTKNYDFKPLDLSVRGDRIYFLNTGSSDAILIESDGKYALVDAAEDSDNPRNFPSLVFAGTEEHVLNCVKKIAGDENGKVTLEFILGTHAHSDHIGGFDTLLEDKDITVKKAYVGEYDEKKIRDYEVEKWDNKEVYTQMVEACEKRNVPVIHNPPAESFALGNFTLTFKNINTPENTEPVGENENSIGLLIERDGARAFLAADINNLDGDEDRLAKDLGKVNLLKVGHHGYDGSTSRDYAVALSPDIAVLTNTIHGLSNSALKSLNAAGSSIYATKEHSGIVAEFTADGITLYDNIDAQVK